MKKSLLLISLMTSALANAQFNQANEPGISESESMYLCDSNYTNYANVTGTSVTWDYSQIASYAGELRDVEVIDATTTSYAADYPTSTKAMQLGDNIVTFFTGDASSRTSQGFVFTEPSLGDIKATFDVDNLIQLTYPASQGTSFSDDYEGTISNPSLIPVPADLIGTAHISVDGEGTLQLPLGVSVSNVLRLKSIDTAEFNVMLLGDFEVVREQFEYYDLSSQNLPIFIHTTMHIFQAGATDPMLSSSLVLSKYATENFVGIDEKSTVDVKVYPNPAVNEITIEGLSLEKAKISFINQAGKTVKTISEQVGSTINVNDLSNGIYIVIIEKEGQQSMTKFTKK